MTKVAEILSLGLGTAAIFACGCAKIVEPVRVTAPARLENRGTWTYLTVSNGNQRYEMPWSMPPQFGGLIQLENDKVYAFTILEERSGKYVVPKVVRVEQDGKVLYDQEICEVHQQKMELRKVPIVYGLILPVPGEPSAKTERDQFPHYREESLGGCVSWWDSPKSTKIFVCSKCKDAHRRWRTQSSASN